MYLSTGIGCAGIGCSQGMGCCGGVGALTMDGTGLFGTGLFASGLDLGQWGAGEILAAMFGMFVLYSVFSTTSRGARRVGRTVKRVAGSGERRRKAKAEKLRSEARRLEGDSYQSSKRSRGGGW